MHALYSNHIEYNETPTLPVLNGPPSWVVRSASKKRPIRSSIQTVYISVLKFLQVKIKSITHFKIVIALYMPVLFLSTANQLIVSIQSA